MSKLEIILVFLYRKVSTKIQISKQIKWGSYFFEKCWNKFGHVTERRTNKSTCHRQ